LSDDSVFSSLQQYDYRDEEVLRKLYWEKGLKQSEIADKFGVCTKTISNWMDENDIEVRTTHRGPAPFFTDKDGYEYWKTEVLGDKELLPVHRLTMVAHCGFDEVTDNVVHHQNEIPWDNRPNNLTVMSESEHKSHHQQKRYEGKPWKNPDRLHEEYVVNGKSMHEVADELNTTVKTVHKYIHEFDIPVRENPIGEDNESS